MPRFGGVGFDLRGAEWSRRVMRANGTAPYRRPDAPSRRAPPPEPPRLASDVVKPVLVVNPRNDPEFVATATRLAATGARTPELLMRKLRERFPSVLVRARELSGEPEVWYVYREGRWVDSSRS